MQMIAPPAKVLAEANGVDWRGIEGSGDAGEVVEQDILNYLTRVMSGEEAPSTDPLDPPPGWDGELPSPELLTAAGVDADIAEFALSARPAGLDLGLDALDFELEFDDDEAEHEEHRRRAVTRDPEDMAHELEDAEYAGADVVETPVHPGAPIIPGPLNPGLPARPLTEPASGPAPAYVDPAQDAPPHPPENPMDLPEGSPEVQGDPEDGVPETEDVPSEEESGWHDPQASAALDFAGAPAPVRSRAATLRLSFDASALAGAGAQLAEHFGRPAPLAAFVARAAARHARGLGLSSVGVLKLENGPAPVATPNLLGDFRSAVADLHAARPGAMADLMVVDAGELGLDELELPLGGAALSLGRLRGREATLTLSGDLPVRDGAAFLRAVAASLETPIRLLL